MAGGIFLLTAALPNLAARREADERRRDN